VDGMIAKSALITLPCVSHRPVQLLGRLPEPPRVVQAELISVVACILRYGHPREVARCAKPLHLAVTLEGGDPLVLVEGSPSHQLIKEAGGGQALVAGLRYALTSDGSREAHIGSQMFIGLYTTLAPYPDLVRPALPVLVKAATCDTRRGSAVRLKTALAAMKALAGFADESMTKVSSVHRRRGGCSGAAT
jgi:hypothetical protein